MHFTTHKNISHIITKRKRFTKIYTANLLNLSIPKIYTIEISLKHCLTMLLVLIHFEKVVNALSRYDLHKSMKRTKNVRLDCLHILSR